VSNAAANKELIRHIMEDGFNKADMAVVYDSFVPEYERHGFGVASMGSLEEHVADLKSRHAAFDNARFEIHEMTAEGSTVAVRYTFHGTHSAEFMGLAATGREVSRPSTAFFDITDGKVTQGRIVSDGGGLMAQLTAD
jgi:predicted ester cyclase